MNDHEESNETDDHKEQQFSLSVKNDESSPLQHMGAVRRAGKFASLLSGGVKAVKDKLDGFEKIIKFFDSMNFSDLSKAENIILGVVPKISRRPKATRCILE